MSAPARRTRAAGSGSRRGASLRRRLLALVAIGALAVIAYVVFGPTLHRAVREVTLPLRHEDIIRQQAREKHLNPALIAGVIFAESKFRDQTSSTGAKGLMQIQPETAKFIAQRSGGTRFQLQDLGTPQINISYGSFYLRYLLDRYGGNEVLALAAYNAGETNVDRWLVDSGRRGKTFTADRIPFAETRAYVGRVEQAKRDYRANYRHELGL